MGEDRVVSRQTRVLKNIVDQQQFDIFMLILLVEALVPTLEGRQRVALEALLSRLQASQILPDEFLGNSAVGDALESWIERLTLTL